jgi:membrane-associated phospholipid phosphatase
MNEAPWLNTILAITYNGFAIQTTAIVFVLAKTGHALQLRILILSFTLLTLITIAISTLMPAQGVWGYLHLSAINSPTVVPTTRDLPLPVFFGLRDGTYRQLVAQGAEGIISFPSLHAALARSSVYNSNLASSAHCLVWISTERAMIAATPVDGSHYFSDVFAGLALAMLSWIVVRHFVVSYMRLSRPAEINSYLHAPPIINASFAFSSL